MKIFFKDFVFLNSSEKQEILSLRNQNYIRENMINSDIISLENHISFINSLKDEPNKKYFAIYVENELIGSLNFVKNEELSWGIYFKNETNPILKVVCTYLFLNFVFENFEEDINSFVKKTNTKAFGFNKNFGFETFREDGVYFYLKLSKSAWENHKNKKIIKPIQKYLAKIEYYFT